MHHVLANINVFEIQRTFVPYEKSARRCPSLKILQDAPKTDRQTFKFLKSMCFIKCEKWSLVCSENGDFQKH